MENDIEYTPKSKKSFEDKLSEYDEVTIKNLKTIIIWTFESINNPEDKYFFIVNNLYNSNYREKIRGRLLNGFKFTEEIDTGEELQRDDNGNLTYNSIIKLHTKHEKLKSQYKGSFV